MDNRFNLHAYQYHLPEELIAQEPADRRDQSRLLILNTERENLQHTRFDRIVDIFEPGDLLVVNNTKVFPARLLGRKETGGRVEMLLLHFPEHAPGNSTLSGGKQRLKAATALCLIKSSKRPKPGSLLHFTDSLQARVDGLRDDGKVEVTLLCPAEENLEQLINNHGRIPLPPYIIRKNGSTNRDAQRYQTTYAVHTGSVAAPTAGLHFSESLIKKLEEKGVHKASVTLHVGYGTFAPVRCDDIREHVIHEEFVRVPEETARAITRTQRAGGRIWAVGTTTARTLEYAADSDGRVQPVQGLCGLYIYPGYRFKVVENLITNFHLPCSSLLFLVSALAGREHILNAYNEAVRKNYRFFSYGDAMAILTRP
jgi:S-adenosylmethionine:tRNA ribosyltransferase-isomerase